MIIDLLSKREQKKILLLYQVFHPDFIPNETFTANYFSVLLNEINHDFSTIELPILIMGSKENLKLHNPSELQENHIFLKMFNFYSIDSPSILLIDQLIHYTYNDQEFSTDSIAEELYMTRQNVYKLLEKINLSIEGIGLRILTKNAIIELEGNPINAIAQIYRYYSLHYRHIFPERKFNLLRTKIGQRLKHNNITFIHKESLSIIDDLYYSDILTNNKQINKVEFYFLLLEMVGTNTSKKRAILDEVKVKKYHIVDFSLEITRFFQQYLNFDLAIHDYYYIFDILILTIFSMNIEYRDFDTFIIYEERENDPNIFAGIQEFKHISNGKYNEYLTKNFTDLIELFIPLYNNVHIYNPIRIHVSISKSPAFNTVIKNRIDTFINKELYIFDENPENSDIIISDIRKYDNNKTLLVSDLNTQLSSPVFYSRIITKLNELNK